MQSEQTWMDMQDEEISMAKERYAYFTRPEPKENLGPIYEEEDKYLGIARCRDVKIGMLRNTSEENKKIVKAYLEPFPHIRVDNIKPLQGWYKSLEEAPGVRPRPCFTEAILTEPYGGYCAVGCQFSLPAGEPINTPYGPKKIEDIQIGDIVYGRTTNGIVPVKVLGTSKHTKPEGYLILTLSDGRIIRMTADHPVYSVNQNRWIRADQIGPWEELEDGQPIIGHNVENPKIKSTRKVTGSATVFDIETESGNFYQNWILVHNCYINSGNRGYRGTGLISVPMDYHLQVAHQLKIMRRAAAGYFSSFTDPFTPLEQYYHNTQKAAEEFVKIGLPIFFLSRLPYPEWAVDLLTKNRHSYAQKSLNTCDPRDWQLLSPGAMALDKHLEEITMLKKRGIYVSIQCNPIVPGITSNAQVVELFRMLSDAGADHVIIKFVEANYSWAPSLIERLIKRFGERGQLFAKLFTDNQGGERVIEEKYRLDAHKEFAAAARKLGLTYATCYEYRYKRDKEGNIIDKTGISIGREFTTADQCHGHKVPVYARMSEEEQFVPLDECPPSGCLYCAEENEGEPRCGDELAGQARALKLGDLRKPIGSGERDIRIQLPLI